MTEPPVTDERKAALLAVSAAFAAQQFGQGQRGRVSRRGAVHDVATVDWFGVNLPAPACHVGTNGWDFTRLKPTTDETTCRRCKRLGAARAAPVLVLDRRGAQLALDLDALTSASHQTLAAPGEDYNEGKLPA